MKLLSNILILLLLAYGVNATFDFDLSKQDSGIVSGLEGKTLILSVDGKEGVELKIDRVGAQRMMATFDSDEILVIDLGQSKMVDLDGDGVDDVKINLNNIIDKLVSLKIEKISVDGEVEDVDEVIGDVYDDVDGEETEETGEEDETEVTGEEVTGNVVSDVRGKIGGLGKWVLAAVIVVIVIIIIVFVYKGGEDSERFYNKAMDLHREGQEFHWDDDDETAEELYEKANEFREKARNLEGGF